MADSVSAKTASATWTSNSRWSSRTSPVASTAAGASASSSASASRSNGSRWASRAAYGRSSGGSHLRPAASAFFNRATAIGFSLRSSGPSASLATALTPRTARPAAFLTTLFSALPMPKRNSKDGDPEGNAPSGGANDSKSASIRPSSSERSVYWSVASASESSVASNCRTTGAYWSSTSCWIRVGSVYTAPLRPALMSAYCPAVSAASWKRASSRRSSWSSPRNAVYSSVSGSAGPSSPAAR